MGARLLRSLLVACILAAAVSPAQAQYFGRNKVRYDDAGFQTLQTTHFDIYFRPDSAKAAQIASRLAERWYLRLSRVLEHELSDRQPLVLYPSHAAFEQTNVVPERDRLSIDVFVADTSTSHVRRKLVTLAADPHFENLDFLRSAGAWSPGGDRLLLSTVRRGRPVLAIYDIDAGAREREVTVNGVDQIFQPSWSPDGRFVAFTGLAHGLSDLYLFDLTGGELRQLTDDAFTDLQPAWSPRRLSS